MLLRTLRNVVAEDLESDQYEILDKVLETADKDCSEMQSGTFGSSSEEFATRLASRQKQQLSKHLKSIELHVSKARAERHWRLKGILAKEVERASRAREDMNRYRLELNRVTGLTPKREDKNVPREKSIVPSTSDEDKKATLPSSPNLPQNRHSLVRFHRHKLTSIFLLIGTADRSKYSCQRMSMRMVSTRRMASTGFPPVPVYHDLLRFVIHCMYT